MMKIKAVFFDIDGTLLNDHGSILPSTKRAIALARAQGIYCGIATGRGLPNVKQVISSLPMDMFVTYNGQYVIHHDHVIYAHPFDVTTLKEIVQYAHEHKRQALFGSGDKMMGSLTMRIGQSKLFSHLLNHLPKGEVFHFGSQLLKKLSPNQKALRYQQLSILQEPIYQCVMLCSNRELVEMQQFLPNCDFQRSNPYSVDIVPKGGSKIKGIKEFADYLGIEMSEIMAFGDHLNDLEMLAGVGIGVAMGNAQEIVKQKADFVTLSNNHDGIYYAMKQFEVI
ncbi:hypothetical protein RR47_GL000543 [Enterococcus columbae DSM 7374 = ATCC 51263]|nr:hypothetical protein RR47_GL000543 [Enterococcus columbae DSM 7374 = ATCC 51263]